jgi:hypothetical protein
MAIAYYIAPWRMPLLKTSLLGVTKMKEVHKCKHARNVRVINLTYDGALAGYILSDVTDEIYTTSCNIWRGPMLCTEATVTTGNVVDTSIPGVPEDRATFSAAVFHVLTRGGWECHYLTPANNKIQREFTAQGYGVLRLL